MMGGGWRRGQLSLVIPCKCQSRLRRLFGNGLRLVGHADADANVDLLQRVLRWHEANEAPFERNRISAPSRASKPGLRPSVEPGRHVARGRRHSAAG
jgi:hypothetical protein